MSFFARSISSRLRADLVLKSGQVTACFFEEGLSADGEIETI